MIALGPFLRHHGLSDEETHEQNLLKNEVFLSLHLVGILRSVVECALSRVSVK